MLAYGVVMLAANLGLPSLGIFLLTFSLGYLSYAVREGLVSGMRAGVLEAFEKHRKKMERR